MVIVGLILVYFAFTPKVQSDLPPEDILPTTFSGETTETGTNFEASFYQDLSDLFGETTNGYEDIQGEYGFIAS